MTCEVLEVFGPVISQLHITLNKRWCKRKSSMKWNEILPSSLVSISQANNILFLWAAGMLGQVTVGCNAYLVLACGSPYEMLWWCTSCSLICFCLPMIYDVFLPAEIHYIHTCRTYIPCLTHHYSAKHSMLYIPCHAYHAIDTSTMLDIPCYTYHAFHTFQHIRCHKYHSTHTRLLDTCHPTQAMPHIPCHTYHAIHTMPYIHTYTPHTDICAYLRAYMRMYFCAYWHIAPMLLQRCCSKHDCLQIAIPWSFIWNWHCLGWAVSKTNEDTSSWFWGSLDLFLFVFFTFPLSINIHCLMRSLIHPSCSNVRSNGCSYEWFDTGMHPPTLCEGEGHLTKVFCIAEHRKISFSMVQPYIFVAFHQCPDSIVSCSSFEGQLVNKALPKNRIDPTVLLPMVWSVGWY